MWFGLSGYRQHTKGRDHCRGFIKNSSVFAVLVMLLPLSARGLWAAILGLHAVAAAAAAAIAAVEVPSVQRVHDVLLTNSR